MGVSAPFKGTIEEWLEANGLASEGLESAGRWELRYNRGLRSMSIAAATSPIKGEASIQRSSEGWTVHSNQADLPAHAPFEDPRQAFRSWVEIAGK